MTELRLATYALDEANAKVTRIASTIGRTRTRLQSLPRWAWVRRARLTRQLNAGYDSYLHAITVQDRAYWAYQTAVQNASPKRIVGRRVEHSKIPLGRATPRKL